VTSAARGPRKKDLDRHDRILANPPPSSRARERAFGATSIEVTVA
jgi:hypothetical protein